MKPFDFDTASESSGHPTRSGTGGRGAAAAALFAGTALVAAALTACGGSPAGQASERAAPVSPDTSPVAHGSTRAATDRCRAAHLKPSVAASEGAAGNVYYDLVMTNTGTGSCALKGYPGVSLIRRDGSTVGEPATREGVPGAAIVLAPGASAHTTLHTVNRGVSDADCWGRHDLLKVYPPGSTDPLTLRDGRVRVCGDTFTVTTVATRAK